MKDIHVPWPICSLFIVEIDIYCHPKNGFSFFIVLHSLKDLGETQFYSIWKNKLDYNFVFIKWNNFVACVRPIHYIFFNLWNAKLSNYMQVLETLIFLYSYGNFRRAERNVFCRGHFPATIFSIEINDNLKTNYELHNLIFVDGSLFASYVSLFF